MSLSRQRPRARAGTVFAALALVGAAAVAAGRDPPLREVGRMELPGIGGRIDHLAIDLEGRRLFVAALGADEVEVVDIQAGRRVGRLTGVREPQGVAYLPSLHRLIVAGGESGDVVAFEGDKRVGAATGLPDADNVRFFAPTGRVVVGYGHALAVVDPVTLAVVERIALPGHPEAFELAEHGPQIYVNVPESGRIVVVDRRTGRTVAAWPVAPEAANFPMALDEAAHRLYVGTRRPARLLVYDTAAGRVLSRTALCGDADDLFLDTERSRLIALCGEGEVDVFSTRGAPGDEPPRRIASAPGARTGLYVSATGTLFVAEPARDGAPARIQVYRAD